MVINGAGAAGVAVVKLLLKYGFNHIIACDREGTIYAGRAGLNFAKRELAEATNYANIKGGLGDAIKNADIFIGLSAAGTLSAEMVQTMNRRPIVFALANPTPEIMPEEAKDAGAFIIATGRRDYPNQINNVLVFPGLFRGALDNRVKQITDSMLIRAAENLAHLVETPTAEEILPSPFNKEVAKTVAGAVY